MDRPESFLLSPELHGRLPAHGTPTDPVTLPVAGGPTPRRTARGGTGRR